MGKRNFIFLSLVLAVAFFRCANAWAIKSLPQYGSFDFTNTSIAEALQIIGQDAGIIIDAPFDQLNTTVQKSYKDIPISQIIRDIMKRQNNAIVWHYLDKRIVAIKILLVPNRNDRNIAGNGTPVIRADNSMAQPNHIHRQVPPPGRLEQNAAPQIRRPAYINTKTASPTVRSF